MTSEVFKGPSLCFKNRVLAQLNIRPRTNTMSKTQEYALQGKLRKENKGKT